MSYKKGLSTPCTTDSNRCTMICASMGSEKQIAVALLVVVFVAFSCASPTAQSESTRVDSGYVESAQCKVPRSSAKLSVIVSMDLYNIFVLFFQDTDVCTYRFAATQQFFRGDLLQNYTLSAAVRVDCYSGKQRINPRLYIPITFVAVFLYSSAVWYNIRHINLTLTDVTKREYISALRCGYMLAYRKSMRSTARAQISMTTPKIVTT